MGRFNIGQESGLKLDAEAVSREMRRTRGEDGKQLFKVPEFLTAQQVSSFFSRMAAKIKQRTIPQQSNDPSEQDLRAMEDEVNFSMAKNAVYEELQIRHPITYDHYNIYSLVKTGSLARLKLDVLKFLCEKFELPISFTQRVVPAISSAEDLVNWRGCNSLWVHGPPLLGN